LNPLSFSLRAWSVRERWGGDVELVSGSVQKEVGDHGKRAGIQKFSAFETLDA